MPGPVFLEGEKINLRTVEEEDMDFLKNVNLSEIRAKTLAVKRPQNSESMQEYFEESIQGEDSINLLICKEREPLGIVSLIYQKEKSKILKLGLWLHPKNHGKGFGTEASELIIDYGFEQLNTHKIFYRVHEDNEASQRLAEKLGLEKEARLEDHAYTLGEYKDVIYYKIMESDRK